MNNNVLAPLLTQAAREVSQKKGLIIGDAEYSYTELQEYTARVANVLRSWGIGPGHQVFLALNNSFECYVCLNALFSLDAIACLAPIDLKPDEAKAFYSSTPLDAVISYQEFTTPEQLAHAIISRDGTLTVTTVGKPQRPAPGNEHGYAVRMLSSGTSGVRKQMLHTGDHLVALAIALQKGYQLTSDDVMMNIAPIYHIIGIGTYTLCLYLKTTLVTTTQFNPSAVLEDIERRGVSFMVASPFAFDVLAKTQMAAPRQLSSLRRAVSGGAPLTEEVYTRFTASTGVGLHQVYGSTEATAVTGLIDNGDFRPGNVGNPLLDVEVAIVDENGVVLPPQTEGLVAVKGPMVIERYEANEAANQELFKNGYLLMSDRGVMDSNGQLLLRGRANLVINVGGNKVDIMEVERVLSEHPSIAEAAVYGIQENGAETVCAALVLREDKKLTPEDLADFCLQKLSAYKVPKKIIFVESLPRDLTGKLARSVLPLLEK